MDDALKQGKGHTLKEEGRKMKMKITNDGRKIIASTPGAGEHEILYCESESDRHHDYFRAVAPESNKRLGVPAQYLAWLPGEVEVPFNEIIRVV